MKTYPFPTALAILALIGVPAIAVRAQAPAAPASATPTASGTTSTDVAITPAATPPTTAETTTVETAAPASPAAPASADTASTSSVAASANAPAPMTAAPADAAATASAPAEAPASAAATTTPDAAAAPAAATATSTTSPAVATPAETATATTTTTAAATPAKTTPKAVKGTNAAGEGTLSVDFPDEDIRNILRNVADLFELNIIMPESLQGKTTIKLRNVTWRQIFENVLDPVGYTYVEDGNIIKIVSKESLNQEPMTTQVFVINYARAADILPTISSLVDTTKGGKIVVDSRSNSLVITERPTRLSRIEPIIQQLDHATDQVMIESKFVEVSDTDVKNIGVNWSSLAGETLTAGNLGSTFDRSRSQTVTDTGTGTNAPTTTGSNALNFLREVTNTGVTSRDLTAVFSADDFKLILSALQTQSDVKIVSNPTIVTLNNNEAEINVGESDPIPNYTYNQQTGSFEVNGFNYKDIGVILKVTPQVNARGFIKLTLSPEVSQKNGYAQFGVAQIPIIATRQAHTEVSLRDGYTMAIGGLLSTQTTKGYTKVPVLGSIPVLGRLFRSNNHNALTTNLIIFITAKTVSADGAPVEQVFNSARVRDLGMRREDMPGYRDGSSPFVDDVPAATKKP